MKSLECGNIIAGRYELLDFRAEYEKFSIYSALDLISRRTVSLKVCSGIGENAADQERLYAEHMRKEAQVLSFLRHPNLVRVEEYFLTEDGEALLVLEELEGLSLASLLKENNGIDFAAAFPIMISVCEGLDFAHRKKILHTELSPACVFLAFNRHLNDFVKIIDFGASVYIGEAEYELERKCRESSACCRAPELLAAEGVDERCDLFGLAAFFFELLSGSPAFSGLEINAAAAGRPLSVPNLRKNKPCLDIPDGLEELIMRNLQKQPFFRHASVLEFKEKLLQIVGVDSVARLEDYMEKARAILFRI